jgi:hypothetical protein
VIGGLDHRLQSEIRKTKNPEAVASGLVVLGEKGTVNRRGNAGE